MLLIRTAIIIALAMAITAGTADAKIKRSSLAKAEFKRQQPCPRTGSQRGACHGYIIDHVVPLCAGGADAPSNMQWQTVADAKAKDRDERVMCQPKPR